MRIKETLMFTGLAFWVGLGTLGWSAYWLLNAEPTSPALANNVFESVASSSIARYATRVLGVVGLLLALAGWAKARALAKCGAQDGGNQ